MTTTASPYSWSASAASALARQLDRFSERSLTAAVEKLPALGLLEWTRAHRYIGDQKLDPSLTPWLADLYDCRAPEVWVMKASQVFISEWMTSTALWVADAGHAGRGNALYIFPTQGAMDDFAQARLGKAIDDSPYLTSRVGKTLDGSRGVARVRLKRLGAGHIYLRGSEKRNQIISVDADCLLCDEVDEFKAGVVDVARKRLNSSLAPLIRGGSTPKFPGSGIAPIFKKTSRRRYLLRCGACALEQPLAFPQDPKAPRSLLPDGRLVCVKCGRPMDNRAKGRWVAEDPTAAVEGFAVGRLYSHRANLAALATLGYSVLEGRISDQSAIQEFWNQDIGEPYAPEGGSLSEDVIAACERDFTHPSTPTGLPVVMGVDVGAVLHVYVKCRAPGDDPRASRTLLATTTRDWGDLDMLMERFPVNRAVIDGMPEDGKAMDFCRRHPGRAYCCFYPSMTTWQHKESAVWNPKERTVSAHRTRSLDALMARFYQQLETLPKGSAFISGLHDQLKAPVRVVGEDANGRPVARYEEGSAADHYCHAANYAEIAWEAEVKHAGLAQHGPQINTNVDRKRLEPGTDAEQELVRARRALDAIEARGKGKR